MFLSRYFHTLRYLRPVQLYGRFWFRLNPARPNARPGFVTRASSGPWVFSTERPAAMIDGETFRILNVDGKVRSPGDWNDPSRKKLWLYNLHYFDDLTARQAPQRMVWHRALIARWVAENPPGVGNGWEPYPTSLRIVNWVKWSLAGNAFEHEWVQSLGVQARWLRRRIEWHLLGNHLFSNAKALVFAGLFFAGDEPAEWLELGLRILRRELPEQILTDGGHFERSPMYHAIILGDVLDLVNAPGAWPGRIQADTVRHWREVAARMQRWLTVMCHPDGEVSFFNDAAFGVAPPPEELSAYARRMTFPPIEPLLDAVTHLAESGYVRVQRGPLVALLDVAPIGPDYLPGHGHADTLSFELSLFGQRVLVNSGTSEYGVGTERSRQRGTAAHNTVTVDGLDSSEVWSGFRVARRARLFDLRFAEPDGTFVVSCSHDGYQRLPGRPVHHREWRIGNNGLRVMDRVSGIFTHAIARFYLHPGVEILTEQALRLPNGECVQWSVSGGTLKVVRSLWYPEFGASIANQCIEIQFEGPEVSFQLYWK